MFRYTPGIEGERWCDGECQCNGQVEGEVVDERRWMRYTVDGLVVDSAVRIEPRPPRSSSSFAARLRPLPVFVVSVVRCRRVTYLTNSASIVEAEPPKFLLRDPHTVLVNTPSREQISTADPRVVHYSPQYTDLEQTYFWTCRAHFSGRCRR